MTTEQKLREVAKKALEAMEEAIEWRATGVGRPPEQTLQLEADALRAALTQSPAPEQQAPQGCGHCDSGGWCGRRDCGNIATPEAAKPETKWAELPPLPDAIHTYAAHGGERIPAFSAKQMQDYARAALLAADSKAGGEVFEIKRQLVKIHDALSNHLGDTDPDVPEDMSDAEIAEDMPIFWAAKEIAGLIGDAPWSNYNGPRGKREPFTDEQVEDLRGDANRGFFIEKEDYFKAFRDAERAHGIGDHA